MKLFINLIYKFLCPSPDLNQKTCQVLEILDSSLKYLIFFVRKIIQVFSSIQVFLRLDQVLASISGLKGKIRG